MADITESYLQQELAKAQRTFKFAVIAMCVVTVFVIGYFAYLKSEVEEILKPDSLAEFIVNETRRNIPVASEAIKANIRDSAPDVVAFITGQVVDSVLPMVRTAFESNLRDYSADIANTGTDGVLVAFEELVKDYKGELETSGDLDVNTDTIALKMSGYVQEQLTRKLDEKKEETLQQKLDESAATLHRINEQLTAMANDRHPEREQELGRRLITTWWTFLERNKTELPGAEFLQQEPEPEAGVN